MVTSGLAACLVSSCLYDKDAPCGDLAVYRDKNGENERCVCPEGTVSTAEGCVLQCGEHEVPTDDGCECEAGFERPEPGEPCSQPGAGGAGGSGTTGSGGTAGAGGAAGDNGGGTGGGGPSGELGVECDPDASSSTCLAPYDHCEPNADTGYCTNADCSSDTDCDEDYACNAAGVCQRPPSGLDKPCESPADCEGLDASFCETAVTGLCHVPSCSVDNDTCFPGYGCCDLSAFVGDTLCVPEGACPQ